MDLVRKEKESQSGLKEGNKKNAQTIYCTNIGTSLIIYLTALAIYP